MSIERSVRAAELSTLNRAFLVPHVAHVVSSFKCLLLFPHAQDCRTGKVETCKVSMDSWVDSYGAQKEAFLKETVLKNRKCNHTGGI